MKAYVLTNGVDFVLQAGGTGRIFEGSPMYFEHMDEAGKVLVERPLLVFMDYQVKLVEINP